MPGGDNGSSDVCFRRLKRVVRPSSYAVGMVGLSLTYTFLGVCGVLLIIAISQVYANPVGKVVFLALIGVFAVLALAMLLALGWAAWLGRLELRRGGYSVRPLLNAIQIEGRTAVVIREAGEPLLSAEERKVRVKAAREWAKTNPVR